MNHCRVSRLAQSDLDDIWFYIAGDNINAADKWIRTILSRFSKLVELPDLGRPREELAPHLRSLPVGRYVIFYRRMNHGIEIVRVLHGARDLPPLFE